MDAFPHEIVPLISQQVEGANDWQEVFNAVVGVLSRLICCDNVVWTGVDKDRRRVLVQTDRQPYDSEMVRLLIDLDDHPTVNHFMSVRGAAEQPLRIGDLVGDRKFRRTRTWQELFRPQRITRQLTVLTEINAGLTATTGWSLNRDGRDFSDDDVAALAALRPLLTALEISPAWRPDPDRVLAGVPGSVGATVRLTLRETEVLALLADGLTAVAIGHRLRISPLTVRKHLEHIYDKTGRRGRLQVVAYARNVGLIRLR